MKNNSTTNFLLLLVASLLFLSTTQCLAKINIKEKDVVAALCTTGGTIGCPDGYKPTCPKQYIPSCVFLTNKQLPACLADSPDKKIYNYRTDLIKCKKSKWDLFYY